MGFETILFEKQDRVATLTLNRPERHNAFNVAMARELREAWARVARDGEIVVAILTGAGEKAFCTGMDVADVADGSARETARGDVDDPPWFHLTAIQNRCWKPVITAVNGMVVGGGLHFVADSDLILAAEHASFFDTHVKVGLIAGLEPVGLLRRIPLEAVLRMALLGGSERMDARRAYEVGLVGEVLPPERLLPRARELAALIAEHSPTALARSKQAIWESLDVGLHEGLRRAWKLIQEHTGHPDLDEGTKAFVERRKPRWAPLGECRRVGDRNVPLEVADGVATVTLHRPEKLNAYTTEMGEEVVAAFRALREDGAVRAVILTGAGRAFCAGVDLEHLRAHQAGGNASAGPRLGEEDFLRRFPLELLAFPKPVIAAVNGAAIGVGVTMILPCDVRLAALGAKLGLTFAKLGLLPGLGSTHLLPRLVGRSRALELVLTARTISAEEAAAIGLVSRAVPGDALLAEARALAAEMASVRPEVLAAAKAALLYGEEHGMAEAMENEQRASAALRRGG